MHNYDVCFTTDADGTPKLCMVWSECTDSFQMQPVYEEKTYNFRQNILRDILQNANIISPPKTSHEVSGKLGRGAIRSYARK